MKILFLTNNAISEPLIEWLSAREEVTVHEDKLTVNDIGRFAPELIVSYSYRHILKREVLDTMPGRFVNLHISLLPFNRGADPNAWSCLDGTPKGVTIHEIDEGIDTGPILVQQPVVLDESKETLASSYSLLHETIQALFIAHWGDLRAGRVQGRAQRAAGTFHRSDDFARLKDRLLGVEGWNVPIALLRTRYQAIAHS
ncbi:MAG TPA: formyltransferase family protein [Trinickia sp.]